MNEYDQHQPVEEPVPRDDQQSVTMTRHELRELMGEVVDETLTKLGIEAQDHREMQADMLFLRKLRTTHDNIGGKAIWTLVATIITATLILIGMGLRSWFGGGGTTP